jgi:hypothetical protein
MSKKLTTASSRLTSAALLAATATLVTGCLEVNTDYKPKCFTDDYEVTPVCDQNREYCASSRFCVAENNTTDPHYPERKYGPLAISFPLPGRKVGGNTLITATVSQDTVKVQFWGVDAQMTHIPLGESVNGSFAWRPADIGGDSTHIFVRSFDAQGNRQQPDSPSIPVIITAK